MGVLAFDGSISDDRWDVPGGGSFGLLGIYFPAKPFPLDGV